MHALALSAEPGLVYWNGATVEACRIRAAARGGVRGLLHDRRRPAGQGDLPARARPRVADALRAIPGVLDVLRSGLGAGAEPS